MEGEGGKISIVAVSMTTTSRITSGNAVVLLLIMITFLRSRSSIIIYLLMQWLDFVLTAFI